MFLDCSTIRERQGRGKRGDKPATASVSSRVRFADCFATYVATFISYNSVADFASRETMAGMSARTEEGNVATFSLSARESKPQTLEMWERRREKR